MISGNMVGSYSQLGKTLMIVDENGTEMVGVVTSNEVLLTANATTDIREGTVAVTDAGIVVGEKIIPAYETTQASRLIRPGSDFTIPLNDRDKYDYTQLQCIIVLKNTTLSTSVAAENVVINDGVYLVGSTNKLSTVTKNSDTKSIDLNLMNNTENSYYIKYFTYREE